MQVIVGGGIAGITAAILLAKKHAKVCIVEKEHELGGLYRSIDCEMGLTFDYGAHYLRTTGVKDLDDILFKGVTDKDWFILGNLKGGSYFRGALNSSSPFLDIRRIPEADYQKSVLETLECTARHVEYTNLDEQLRGEFGETLTDKVFKPIVGGKYFGTALNELAVDAHGLVGVSRLLALTPEASREVKKSDVYDVKFGFHSYMEGASEHKNFYPRKGGVGEWIKLLLAQLKALDVEIVTGESVTSVEHADGVVNAVTLSNGERLACEHLFWTIPAQFLLKAAGLQSPPLSQPVGKLQTSLFHFAFDKPFQTDVHYIQCHDPDFKTFRITLYSNIQGSQNGIHHITSEVISPTPLEFEPLQKQVLKELYDMGVVASDSQVLYEGGANLPFGFPLLGPALYKELEGQARLATETIDNLTFLGRATGRGFRMEPVLLDVHKVITNIN